MPILAKLAPDLDDEQLEAIASIAAEHLIDGVIATNTTTSRPADSPLRDEAGGMSGAPLHALSVAVHAEGVDSEEDAQALWAIGVDAINGPWASTKV